MPKPTLDSIAQREDYLVRHLANELEWLLRAASHWYVQSEQPNGTPGFEVQNLATDSACLHARTLFEFFTATWASKNFCRTVDFDLQPITSSRYTTDWANPLHAYLMHMQDRETNTDLPNDDGLDRPLNEMPVMFAKEVVRLWRAFADQLRRHPDTNLHPLAAAADTCLEKAILDAEPVFEAKHIDLTAAPPLSW